MRPQVFIGCVIFSASAASADPICAGDACSPGHPGHVDAAVRLMAALGDESLAQAAAIRASYARDVRRLTVRDRRELETAIETARLVSLPAATAGNVHLRRTGAHPIGEMDLAHQHLYATARPETIGCLLHVASRVRSGTLEVTSLVRHRDYQHRLARRNANARTEVPTHVMGLAFDVSILHAPLALAAEIRDALRALAADGDLFFIAEQRQLVFHIVPAPARREYFAALYEALALFPRPLIAPPSWPEPPRREALHDVLAVGRAPHGTFSLWPVSTLAAALSIAGRLARQVSKYRRVGAAP